MSLLAPQHHAVRVRQIGQREWVAFPHDETCLADGRGADERVAVCNFASKVGVEPTDVAVIERLPLPPFSNDPTLCYH